MNNSSDEELIFNANSGDQSAADTLMMRYKPLVMEVAGAYFIYGGDRSDLIQEGMIGLFNAVRDYREGRDASFKTFASLCIRRRLIDAVKAANRGKHKALNNSLSLDLPVMADMAAPDNPATRYEELEDSEALQLNLKKALSRYELTVLDLFLKGKNYSEIAVITGREQKSVDNALQRIRKKISLFK
jgi:RNA polymerase sporulation-specific sigma factor